MKAQNVSGSSPVFRNRAARSVRRITLRGNPPHRPQHDPLRHGDGPIFKAGDSVRVLMALQDLGIPTDSPNKDALYEMLNWLLTPERAAIHLPTATAVLADLHLGYNEVRCGTGEAVPAGDWASRPARTENSTKKTGDSASPHHEPSRSAMAAKYSTAPLYMGWRTTA